MIKILLFVFVVLLANMSITSITITYSYIHQQKTTSFSFLAELTQAELNELRTLAQKYGGNVMVDLMKKDWFMNQDKL
jgi:hypothetical protein